MLVLSRFPGEVVDVYTEHGVISIMVTRVVGQQVRLGITVPPECKILRRELKEVAGGASESKSTGGAGGGPAQQ